MEAEKQEMEEKWRTAAKLMVLKEREVWRRENTLRGSTLSLKKETGS